MVVLSSITFMLDKDFQISIYVQSSFKARLKYTYGF